MNENQMHLILNTILFSLYHAATLKDLRNYLVQISLFTHIKTEIQKDELFTQDHTIISVRTTMIPGFLTSDSGFVF